MAKSLHKGYLVPCLIIISCIHTLGITVSQNKTQFSWDARGIGRALAQCLSQHEKLECLKIKVMQTLELALHDNNTWHYGDFVLVEKNELQNNSRSWLAQTQQQQHQQRSIGDRIGDKLLQLAQARSIRLKVPQRMDLLNLHTLGNGISDAVDDIANNINDVVGNTDADVNAGDHADAEVDAGTPYADQGRKKKDKDKQMAMMGGITLVAMLAQMFLGKVILIAGGAFVMAKIALLISLLTSLKKGHSGGGGGGGGGTDHVIVTSAGGGHHESSGWHRSMPYDYHKLEEISMHDDEPETATHAESHGPPHHGPNEQQDHHETSYYSEPEKQHDSGQYSGHSAQHEPSYHSFTETEHGEDFRRKAGFLNQ